MEKLAVIWRRHGIIALENAKNTIENVFLNKGIELVIDGYNRFDIRNIMEKDYELYFSRKESQVNVLNTLAKLAHGFADNMLTTTALACRNPILVAPAMETAMWDNPATRANLQILKRLVAEDCYRHQKTHVYRAQVKELYFLFDQQLARESTFHLLQTLSQMVFANTMYTWHEAREMLRKIRQRKKLA